MARVLIRVYHFNSRLRKETNRARETHPYRPLSNYNSRLRKETNFLIDIGLSAAVEFQFTSPQGDEHKAVSLFISLLLLQLTSPRGDELVSF